MAAVHIRIVMAALRFLVTRTTGLAAGWFSTARNAIERGRIDPGRLPYCGHPLMLEPMK
jgi:hypothetical protein